MNHAASFLDAFVQDEVMSRCLDEGDFGQALDNEENDVPLYDMYNRGLVACEQGLERNPLFLEGMKRPGLTGLIPSWDNQPVSSTFPSGNSKMDLTLSTTADVACLTS